MVCGGFHSKQSFRGSAQQKQSCTSIQNEEQEGNIKHFICQAKSSFVAQKIISVFISYPSESILICMLTKRTGDVGQPYCHPDVDIIMADSLILDET